MSKQPPRRKSYQNMTLDELREATKEFDAPMPGLPGKPLTPRARAAHKHLLAKRGRPTVGAGAERITTTIERGLLKDADAYAQAKGITRAEMIAAGLRLVMSKKQGRKTA
jgi:hypothetical protein